MAKLPVLLEGRGFLLPDSGGCKLVASRGSIEAAGGGMSERGSNDAAGGGTLATSRGNIDATG